MNFASIEFFIFLAIVYPLYLMFNHRWQNYLLLVASYIFYGSWNWRFLFLIFLSTIVDYTVGLRLHNSSKKSTRKYWLMISLISNLGILGFFKYFNFFTDSLVNLGQQFGWQFDSFSLNIILPVGISFYTFQTLSYTIDIYRKEIEPTKNFIDFALFVSFFPQLVAGPIERAKTFLPQVLHKREITEHSIHRGFVLILLGFFKKLVVADGCAQVVNQVFQVPSPSGLEILLASYAFAFQIYGDFSGYSDIARGVSKLLGFDLRLNFNNPYFSSNPSEFWKRWHISLSSWLRDYLYIPLGGNKGNIRYVCRNLMLTMLLGGLWHGAAWNFVFWGFYQGLLLCFHKFFIASSNKKIQFSWWIQCIKTVCFFQFVCYGWMLFRAESMEQILSFTHSLIYFEWTISQGFLKPPIATIVGLVVLLLWDFSVYFKGKHTFYMFFNRPIRTLTYSIFLVILLFGLKNDTTEFIYFQF